MAQGDDRGTMCGRLGGTMGVRSLVVVSRAKAGTMLGWATVPGVDGRAGKEMGRAWIGVQSLATLG